MKEEELGIRKREDFRNELNQQLSAVKLANDDMRAEPGRLREQQNGLKDSLSKTITEGLQDIRDRLAQTSVKEIIAQVPDSFRTELAVEFETALKLSIEHLAEQLNDHDALERLFERLWRDVSNRYSSDEFAQSIASKVQALLQNAVGPSLPTNLLGRIL